MWELGNRDIIVLVSVISGCAILCNVWGPFVALITTILIVIIAWCTFIVADDTPFTPHALLALDYLEVTGREINGILEVINFHARAVYETIARTFKRIWRVQVVERMAQRRRSTYQLSSETFPCIGNAPRLNLVAGLSPIARKVCDAENTPYGDGMDSIVEAGSAFGKLTSTPMMEIRRTESRNGDLFGGGNYGTGRSPWTQPASVSQNHTLSRGEESNYSHEGSPWGTSISPKMRARAGGVKTVQTVAGPLLASTRYNIDPKVFSDVTSPGLTSRLTKYATEANTKLTHQSQYSTGQFPRVNLNTSPTPLINPSKPSKFLNPVTVRVAPPENTHNDSPEYQESFSKLPRSKTKSRSRAKRRMVQVLREISLKRHASRDDVTFDVSKKPKFGLENLEEMTQKRARDDSSKSDEDSPYKMRKSLSSPNESLRPAKRSKMPSCHDIISSLSSSINSTAGVKRKALDVSRCGTPVSEKHFKPLDSSPKEASPTLIPLRTTSEPAKSLKRSPNDLEPQESYNLNKKFPSKVIAKSQPNSPVAEEPEMKIVKEMSRPLPQVPVKLTDRLFMKPEPQNIDKLKTLIEEHGSINPRYVNNESDEIKKSDIVLMRQTSMKARLKSMFDAISGKAPSQINPEVVIQAEEPKPSAITATLSSSTSTTSVNTSPIATSAIVPIIGKSKPDGTPAKHVTFNFTTSQTATTEKKPETSASVQKSETSNFQNFSSPVTTTVAPPPAFGFPVSTTLTTTNSVPAVPSTGISSTGATPATSSPPQFSSTNLFAASTTSSPLFGTTGTTTVKSDEKALPKQEVKTSAAPTMSFAFGKPATTASSTPALFGTDKTTTTAPPAFGTSTSTPAATSSLFTFGGNPPAPSGDKKVFSFGGAPAATAPQTLTSIATPAPTSTSSTFAPSTGSGTFTSAATPAPSAASNLFGTATSTGFPAANTKPAFSFSTATASQVSKSFAFGSSSTAPAATSGSSGPFGGNAPTLFGAPSTTSATTTPSLFGAPVTTAPPAFGATSTTSTPVTPNLFGAAASSAPSAFGASSTTSTITSPSLFGAPSTTAPPAFGATPTTAAPAFGATPTTAPPVFGATPTTAPPAFGTPSTTSTAATPSLFGAPVTAPLAFGTSLTSSTATTPSLFGAPVTTAPPAFGAASSQSSFSSSSSAFGTPKTMDSPAFGTNPAPPPSFAVATGSSSLFAGGNSNATTTSTNALPTFGASGFGQAKPPPAFGSSTGSSSMFGTQTSSASSFGSTNSTSSNSAPIFGATSSSGQSFGSPGTSAFGVANSSTAPPAFGAGNTNTAPPAFGASNISAAPPAFGATSSGAAPPAFGATNSGAAPPAFGAINNSAPSTFGQLNSGQGSGSSVFGAVTTAPSAFGPGVTSPASFGGTGGSFGTTGNQPPAFNSGNNSFSGFGGAANAASPFGGQAAQGNSSFGTASTTPAGFGTANSSSGGGFSFGGNQATTQPPQQGAVFAFGAGNAVATNNAQAGGAAPFQFGNTAPQTGGFNFSGAPSAPALNFSKEGTSGGSFTAPALGAFNAPTSGGMFSIGSGTTGPRTRPSRRRQR